MLREKFEQPEYYNNEKVRGEVFRHFGYFMTESTGHLSEYVPWFRKNQKALDLYCDEPAFGGESGAYYKWGKTMAEKYAEVDPLQYESAEIDPQRRILLLHHRSGRDRQAVQVHGQRAQRRQHHQPAGRLLRGRPRRRKTDRPPPTIVGELPPQCAALHDQHQRPAAGRMAAKTGDPETSCRRSRSTR